MSIEDADWGQQAEETEQADPGGFIAAMMADPGTEVIHTADLPEDPEAQAIALAARIHNLFEGPDQLDIPSDPTFIPLIEAVQQGLAVVENMRIAGVRRDLVAEAIMAWDNENCDNWSGMPVVVQPTRKHIWLSTWGGGVRIHREPTELGDVLEGVVSTVSLGGSGAIGVDHGIYSERHRRRGRRPAEPNRYQFVQADVYGAFSLYVEKPGSPIKPNDFQPGLALTVPAEA